ncbi:hypothetical protein GCM10009808_01070 [Microbacterium sediminicola]|uniref:Glutamine amidotransferase type-2 domain-containing protein n=2 Tax=Microbacterium sediminicola TaxID=415210 RepID=A0ABN2HH47_9MICO
MSRMMAFISREPQKLAAAFAEDRVSAFIALSSLHADGWGLCRLNAAGIPERAVATTPLRDDDLATLDTPTRGAIIYARFASAGSAVNDANIQPFTASGWGFSHNGALSPIETARTLLSTHERATLTGTTDSEVYFTALRRVIPEGEMSPRDLVAIARAVNEVRALFPDACLNAFLLSTTSLVIIQSEGTRGLPAAAFERRGYPPRALPPGHDDGYNRLWMTSDPHSHRVATTGVDVTRWQPLTPDSVTLLRPGEKPLIVPIRP